MTRLGRLRAGLASPWRRRSGLSGAAGAATSALLLALTACGAERQPLSEVLGFRVEILTVNGQSPPSADAPLPANRGDHNETWEFAIDARGPSGEQVPFDGVVRLDARPGAVARVTGEGATGRNI